MAKAKDASTAPKGFRKFETPVAWDFEKNPILQGTVLNIKVIPRTRDGEVTKQKVAQVRDDDGVIHSFWESAALIGFFDELKPGKQIWVKYLGKIDLVDDDGEPTNKSKKQFDAYIK